MPHLGADGGEQEVGEVASGPAHVAQLPVDDHHLQVAALLGAVLEQQVVEVEVPVLKVDCGVCLFRSISLRTDAL